MVKNSSARFEPNRLTKRPNVSDPINAPMQLMLPTHDTCSIEMGPVSNGVSSDMSFGSAGDTHPFFNQNGIFRIYMSICNFYLKST